MWHQKDKVDGFTRRIVASKGYIMFAALKVILGISFAKAATGAITTLQQRHLLPTSSQS